ncbi:hypothetical protein [Azospirillum himalayense]|uniref:Uncharacterized protein n=1 Tax=Azospirillum himalayense TaxID=654847 RepID=A0ABW0GIG3_9PROT
MDSYRKNVEPSPDAVALENVRMGNDSEEIDYAVRIMHIENSQAYLTARSKRMAARIAESNAKE